MSFESELGGTVSKMLQLNCLTYNDNDNLYQLESQ